MTDYINWIFTLPLELQTVVAKHWGYDGRPRSENPVDQLLIDLCKLRIDDGHEAFIKDARTVLVERGHLKEEELRRYYMLFTAGAIWGTIQLQNMIRDEFRSYASTSNP